MADKAFEKWYVEGLPAAVQASEMSEKSSAGFTQTITSPELKRLVEQGSRIAPEHTATLKGLLAKAGGRPNRAMAGIVEDGKQAAKAAGDPAVKDAAAAAALQTALHYYIATYGTLASVAKHLGRADDAAELARLNDWMKQKNVEYTKLAEGVLNEPAKG